MNPKLSLVLGILCISFSPILVRLAGVEPVTTTFYRLGIAWLVLAPYCLYKGGLKIMAKPLLIAMAGGVVLAIDLAVWNISLLKISATVSTLLANLAPVWVGLLSFILFRKRSGLLFWIGTGISVAGMVLLVGYQQVLHLQFNAGIILALISSLLYAIYILITKGVLQQISTLSFMFYSMLASTVVLGVFCLVQDHNMIHFTSRSWLCLIAMGILCQLVGWLTINHALRTLESTRVSVALLMQTVLAGFLAMLLLHERLEAKEIIGSGVILTGIATTFMKQKRTDLRA